MAGLQPRQPVAGWNEVRERAQGFTIGRHGALAFGLENSTRCDAGVTAPHQGLCPGGGFDGLTIRRQARMLGHGAHDHAFDPLAIGDASLGQGRPTLHQQQVDDGLGASYGLRLGGVRGQHAQIKFHRPGTGIHGGRFARFIVRRLRFGSQQPPGGHGIGGGAQRRPELGGRHGVDHRRPGGNFQGFGFQRLLDVGFQLGRIHRRHRRRLGRRRVVHFPTTAGRGGAGKQDGGKQHSQGRGHRVSLSPGSRNDVGEPKLG